MIIKLPLPSVLGRRIRLSSKAACIFNLLLKFLLVNETSLFSLFLYYILSQINGTYTLQNQYN